MSRFFGWVRQRMEYKMTLLIMLVLTGALVMIFMFFSKKLEDSMLATEMEKSAQLASTIHETLDKDMVAFRADVVRHLINDLVALRGVVRLQIVRGDAPYVKRPAQEKAFVDSATLNDIHARIGPAFRDEWVHKDIVDIAEEENIADGTDRKEFQRFYREFIQRLSGPQEELPSADEIRLGGAMDVYYQDVVDGKRVLTYLRPLPNFQNCYFCHGANHKLRGILMITTSLEQSEAALASTRKNLALSGLAALFVVVVIIKLSMSRFVLRPLHQAVDRVQDIAEGEGDLTKRLVVASHDEIGFFAASFNQFVEKLNGIMTRVARTGKQVIDTTDEIVRGTEVIENGARVQTDAAQTTSRSVGEINSSIKGVNERAHQLSALAQESTAAVLEMSASIDGIAAEATTLLTSVEEAVASILRFSSSSKEIHENVALLSSAAEETAASMAQMDASIKQIRGNTHETVEFSKQVIGDADRGNRAVEQTIEGIDRIRQYAQQIFDVMTTLQRRIDQIGKIVTVIDEVAEQTNLLALNAAIIAAQAGEQGKGFAVVANEIKELAERTASSTQEIHEIIQGLQQEGQNAVKLIQGGQERVNEGVQRSEQAREALKKIFLTSEQATHRIRQIASATDEQARTVVTVTEATHKVNEMVQQIAMATNEQSRDSNLLIEATEQMKEIAQKVKVATTQQAQGNKQINQLVEKVSGEAEAIAGATEHQSTQSEGIVEAIALIQRVARENVETLGRVGDSVKQLVEQAGLLDRELTRFKLHQAGTDRPAGGS
ncbi:MAG: methyl-accepting chemotaxis protein [Nitrospirota bacterium]